MFDSLPGFREFYPEGFSVRNALFHQWRSSVEAAGFHGFDGPVLEPLDLYIEKSGEEIVEQLFHFTDKGDRRVALRPEMTPTLGRMVAAKANALRKPIKWYNIGDHFRFERPQKGRTRCFTQLNVDILGEASYVADAESIHTLILVCRNLGLQPNEFTIRLSDRCLWSFAMDSWEIEPSARASVLSAIDKMERMGRDDLVAWLSQHVGDLAPRIHSEATSLASLRSFNELTQWASSLVLSPEQKSALDSRLQEWQGLLTLLEETGSTPYIRIDPSIVRGLAYYTGFVFEAFETTRKSRALAGGGRYDNLVEKMGGPSIPAVGWAMGDVTLLDCLEHLGRLPTPPPRPKVFAIMMPETRHFAMADIDLLRRSGVQVTFSYRQGGFGKQIKEANQAGATHVVFYGSDELANQEVTFKELASGTEFRLPRERLLEHIKALPLS